MEDADLSRRRSAPRKRVGGRIASAPPAAMPVLDDARVGTLLHGRYRLLRRIGAGGYGAVYEAQDELDSGQRVAIELLRPALARDAALVRALRERARRGIGLRHPRILEWKRFDEDEHGTRYLVMELVEGEELGQVLARGGPLEPRRAARVLLAMLDALRAAHHWPGSEPILHLALTPRSVLLVPAQSGRGEEVKVIGLGIGQLLGQERDEELLDPGPRGAAAAPLRFAPLADGEPNAARDFRRWTKRVPVRPSARGRATIPATHLSAMRSPRGPRRCPRR